MKRQICCFGVSDLISKNEQIDTLHLSLQFQKILSSSNPVFGKFLQVHTKHGNMEAKGEGVCGVENRRQTARAAADERQHEVKYLPFSAFELVA